MPVETDSYRFECECECGVLTVMVPERNISRGSGGNRSGVHVRCGECGKTRFARPNGCRSRPPAAPEWFISLSRGDD